LIWNGKTKDFQLNNDDDDGGGGGDDDDDNDNNNSNNNFNKASNKVNRLLSVQKMATNWVVNSWQDQDFSSSLNSD
jgi:hypothetical protein